MKSCVVAEIRATSFASSTRLEDGSGETSSAVE